MTETEAAMLIKAGLIERAVVFYRPGAGGWELHLYGQLPPATKNAIIELAPRGGRRSTWASLDSAYRHLVGLCDGRNLVVEIDTAKAG